MSVTCFYEDALGELGAACLRRSGPHNDEAHKINLIAYWLALFSRDNAKAWLGTYGWEGGGISRMDSRKIRREIEKHYPGKAGSGEAKRAVWTARRLHYNCVSDDGVDHATPRTLKIIVALLGALLHPKR